MTEVRPLRQKTMSDGFVVVAVLWVLGALATLAAIYAVYVTDVARAFVDYDDRLRAQELSKAGVEMAVYQITANPGTFPVAGRSRFHLGDADIGFVYGSEAARIDLNFAPASVLVGLLATSGVDVQEAEAIAERIIAWRSPSRSQDDAEREASLYRAAGMRYRPRWGAFQHVNEIALVLGMRRELVDRVLPYVTVYSGQPEVNVLVAPAAVLAALPAMTPRQLDRLVSLRENAPQDFIKAQLGMAAQFATLQPGKTYRITVEVALGTGRRLRSQAVVVLLHGDSEPYRMLSWETELGGS